MKHKLNNMDKEELRKRMSKAIGTFENEMVYNISNDCAEIAVRYFNEQLKQHGVMQAEGSDGADGAAVASEGEEEANMSADCEHTTLLWINSNRKYLCLDCGKLN
jgi:hypothetical protein